SSFASALYFSEELFHNILADIGVGIIWGYIITNMYVLLLYTISPTLLPTKERKKQKEKTYPFKLSFSMGIRIFIVLLLAIIIAQPLNVLVLKLDSGKLASEIDLFLDSNTQTVFVSDIKKILNENSNTLLASDIRNLISKNSEIVLVSDIRYELDKNSKSRFAS